jgi:hypothetical protein
VDDCFAICACSFVGHEPYGNWADVDCPSQRCDVGFGRFIRYVSPDRGTRAAGHLLGGVGHKTVNNTKCSRRVVDSPKLEWRHYLRQVRQRCADEQLKSFATYIGGPND